MALGSKLEQRVTGRPDSYVPARTLGHLLGLPHPDRDSWTRNMAMHYLAGASAGAVRGVMAAANLRGPFASLMHTNLRLSFYETLENGTGVGAPPLTWPRYDSCIDPLSQGVVRVCHGAGDAPVAPARGSSARRKALAARLKGFA